MQNFHELNSRNELLSIIKGKVLFGELMKHHTTLRIGGPAHVLVIPKDIDDIIYSLAWAEKSALPVQVIGNGSKLLVNDEGLPELVIKICNALDSVQIMENQLHVGAGCLLPKLVRITAEKGLSGLEFAAGIPGTIGGALVMNAGTNLGSMSHILDGVTVFNRNTKKIETMSNNACQFAYRSSVFQKSDLIILSADLKLCFGNKNLVQRTIDELLRKREASQPLDKPNGGSVFRNPDNMIAAKLIDSLSLKGTRIGDAQVSEKHANFIVNLGNAHASDVQALINLVQKEVRIKYNVDLVPELLVL